MSQTVRILTTQQSISDFIHQLRVNKQQAVVKYYPAGNMYLIDGTTAVRFTTSNEHDFFDQYSHYVLPLTHECSADSLTPPLAVMVEPDSYLIPKEDNNARWME